MYDDTRTRLIVRLENANNRGIYVFGKSKARAMELPTEITLKELVGNPDLVAKIRKGQIVARLRGTVHPMTGISRSNKRYRVWFRGFELPMSYGGNKHVVISEE